MAEHYSTVQKLSLAGMVIGFLLCLVGAASPYWIVSEPEGFGVGDLVGKIVKGSIGLFIVCVEALGKEGCEAIENDGDSGWFHTARMAAAGCILLGGISAGISLCLACCNCCKRFVIVGILEFLAAVAGAFCLIVFSRNTEAFTGSIMGFKVTAYGWAYYMFIAGVVIQGVVSFMACFSAPDNPLRGMVLSQSAGGGNQVIVASSTSTATAGHHPYMHLQQEQGGPVMMGPPIQQHSSATVVSNTGY